MIKVTEVESFPPDSNPFHHDAFNMGTKIASNVTIMHPSFEFQRTGIIYVVNTETGERVMIEFVPQEEMGFGGLTLKPDDNASRTR